MLLGVVFRRFLPYILVIGLVAGIILLVDNMGYERGYQDSQREWEAEVAQERERVRIANEAAREAGRMLLMDYRNKMRLLDDEISKLEGEVAKDPSAGNLSIPRSVVRRLNEIQ